MNFLIKHWLAFKKDVEKNQLRYRWLFLLFVFVYFAEVVFSKATGQLTSPERQFWIFWFLSTSFLLIPHVLSIVGALFFTLVLMLAISLGIGSSLTYDLSLWVYIFFISATVAIIVKAKND